jgi:SpoVK/Ycf46/Vps4 family AAA+-type ATPase
MEPLEIKTYSGKLIMKVNTLDQFNLGNINPMKRENVLNSIYDGSIDRWLRENGETRFADALKKLESRYRDYIHANYIWKLNKDEKPVYWKDLYGYELVKEQLSEEAEAIFNSNNKYPSEAILLYGPPGCGKSQLASGFAQKTNTFLIDISTDMLCQADIISETFESARAFAPATLILDEVETVSKPREDSGGVNSTLAMLDELDSNEENKGIAIIGITNYPWRMDSALMRSGRFSKKIFMGPPDKDERKQILTNFIVDAKNDLDLNEVIDKSEFYSGADLKRVSLIAKRLAFKENKNDPILETKHFIKALEEYPPTIIPWLAHLTSIEHPEFAKDYFPDMFKLADKFEKHCMERAMKKIGPGLIT